MMLIECLCVHRQAAGGGQKLTCAQRVGVAPAAGPDVGPCQQPGHCPPQLTIPSLLCCQILAAQGCTPIVDFSGYSGLRTIEAAADDVDVSVCSVLLNADFDCQLASRLARNEYCYKLCICCNTAQMGTVICSKVRDQTLFLAPQLHYTQAGNCCCPQRHAQEL